MERELLIHTYIDAKQQDVAIPILYGRQLLIKLKP